MTFPLEQTPLFQKLLPDVEVIVGESFETLTEQDSKAITQRICEDRSEDSMEFWVHLADIEELENSDDWSDVNGCIESMIEKYIAEQKVKHAYYRIQCHPYDDEKTFTYYLETEGILDANAIVQKLSTEYIGVNGLEQHHVDNFVRIIPISQKEYIDGCNIRDDNKLVTIPERNKFEDAVIAIRDHGWSFSDIDGRRKLLVPPEGDKRQYWTAMWDENGFPHWLPAYSEEMRSAK